MNAIEKSFELDLKITQIYKKSLANNENKAIREAKVLAAQFPASLLPLETVFEKAGENHYLLAGRNLIKMAPVIHHVGFSPQVQEDGTGYFFTKNKATHDLKQINVSETKHAEIKDMFDFWMTEKSDVKVRAAYPKDMCEVFPSDDWMTDAGAVFPLYRLAGIHPDFEKLINLGLPGIKSYASKLQNKLDDKNVDSYHFYDGIMMTTDVIKSCLQHYEKECKTLSERSENKEKYNRLEKVLANLQKAAPSSFYEAVQLIWIYTIVAGSNNFGRMDDYLGPFLEADLKSGTINEEDAISILLEFWALNAENTWETNARIITGGKGRKNEKVADKFALLAIEVTERAALHLPQLTLRFYNGQNPELMERALVCLSKGRTFPILYNDDVNIPAVANAFQVCEKVANEYTPYGCGEYVLNNKSIGTPSGVINMLELLNLTINGGIDYGNNTKLAPDYGCLETFDTFEDLKKAYCKQIDYFVPFLAKQQKLEYDVLNKEASYLGISMLLDDCITKGKAALDGGLFHLGGTLESYGQINAANALYAIKKHIYDDKDISKKELLQALKDDFVGHELIQQKLYSANKYGNDFKDVDTVASFIHEYLCNCTRNQAKEVGLDSYLIVIINNSANTITGRNTAASADGRNAGRFMANGNNPMPGTDTNGVTAFLRSVLRLRYDIHAGATQNMKFTPEIFTESKEKLNALLNVYWKNGGPHAMLTVVNPEDLQNALKHPEQYQNLLVRVGGFSARFVELDKDVQQEVLARTLYA